jgi:hypothetical protein
LKITYKHAESREFDQAAAVLRWILLGDDAESQSAKPLKQTLKESITQSAALSMIIASIVLLWRDNIFPFTVALAKCSIVLRF